MCVCVGFVRQSKEKALRTLIRLSLTARRLLTHSLSLQPTTQSQTIHIEATATAVCNIKSTVNVRTCCFHSSWLSKCRPQGGGWLRQHDRCCCYYACCRRCFWHTCTARRRRRRCRRSRRCRRHWCHHRATHNFRPFAVALMLLLLLFLFTLLLHFYSLRLRHRRVIISPCIPNHK